MHDRMTRLKAVEYFKMRLGNLTHPPTTRQQHAFKCAIDSIEELWQYKALGYSPEELQKIISNTFNADLEKDHE